jgi:hypothetical protein
MQLQVQPIIKHSLLTSITVLILYRVFGTENKRGNISFEQFLFSHDFVMHCCCGMRVLKCKGCTAAFYLQKASSSSVDPRAGTG